MIGTVASVVPRPLVPEVLESTVPQAALAMPGQFPRPSLVLVVLSAQSKWSIPVVGAVALTVMVPPVPTVGYEARCWPVAGKVVELTVGWSGGVSAAVNQHFGLAGAGKLLSLLFQAFHRSWPFGLTNVPLVIHSSSRAWPQSAYVWPSCSVIWSPAYPLPPVGETVVSIVPVTVVGAALNPALAVSVEE